MSGDAHRYRAFICYSQDDRIVAQRLHEKLERYRVPSRLVGRPGLLGPVPAQLVPIFRDRDELAASPDIGARLHEALSRSEFLIVLCSPAAARSRWVDAEIEAFCACHSSNRDRVIAVLLAGEPGGEDPANECFPPALRLKAAAEHPFGGRYPLAADFRPGRDRRSDAELRLIAALLGIEFDELKQRDDDRRMSRLRGFLAAAGGVAVAFAALAIFGFVERQKAQQAAIRTEKSLNEAEKLVDYMLFDLRPKLEAIGKLSLLEPANEKVLDYYARMATESDRLDVLRRRAAAFHQRGLDLRNHGDAKATISMLMTAAGMREEIVKQAPTDAGARLDLADTHRILANQRQDSGDSQGALREIGISIEQAQEAVRLAPDDYVAAARLASLRTEQAESLIRVGKANVAATELGKAVPILEGLLSKHGSDLDLKSRTAAAEWKLGFAYRRMSDFSQAEAQFRRSIELTKELRDSDPSNIVYVRRYQLSLTTLGNMLTEAGHPDQGLPILQQSLAVARDIAAAEPASLIHQATLATTLSQVTAALCNLDRKTDALPFAREEVEVLDRSIGKGATDARTRWTYAMALITYGATLVATGKAADAVVIQRHAVDVQGKVSADDPADLKMRDDLGYTHAQLAYTLVAANSYKDATGEFRTAISIMDGILAKNAHDPQLARKGDKAEWQLGLAKALRQVGSIGEARKILTDCIAELDQAMKSGAVPDGEGTRANANQELNDISKL